MDESMRYITMKEQKRYEEIAIAYNIKGYTPPNSLLCCNSNDSVADRFKAKRKTKRRTRKKIAQTELFL